jgi:hypothetical protein
MRKAYNTSFPPAGLYSQRYNVEFNGLLRTVLPTLHQRQFLRKIRATFLSPTGNKKKGAQLLSPQTEHDSLESQIFVLVITFKQLD